MRRGGGYDSVYETFRSRKRWKNLRLYLFNEVKLSTFAASFAILLLFGIVFGFIVHMTASSSAHLPEPEPVEIHPFSPSKFSTQKAEKKESSTSNGQKQPIRTGVDSSKRPQTIWNKRQEAVRQAFLHAYRGYEALAFGSDELRPVSNETNNSWGGFGITIFDALDTMYLMQLEEPYFASLSHVLKTNFDKDHDASFFEFSIRYIGGLLGAYELSRDYRLIDKAEEMAQRLLPAFDSPTGIPYSVVNLRTGAVRNPKWNRGTSILSELGSVQLEFKYLSMVTGKSIYAEKAHQVMQVLGKTPPKHGLYPVYIDPKDASFQSDLVSVGGLGDSFYEYLLKQYLLHGSQDNDAFLWEMYLQSMEGLQQKMVATTAKGFTFIGEYSLSSDRRLDEMDHLACYVPGMLALGATANNPKAEQHLKLAKEVMNTCYQLYHLQDSGIAPERTQFHSAGDPDWSVVSGRYLLRPETVESLFVLYRTTGSEEYREWGWNIFESILHHCQTGSAFSGLKDVTTSTPVWDNSMQSFFFAETLKYLYLLFGEKTVLPLNEYVFTTEAHALGIRGVRRHQ